MPITPPLALLSSAIGSLDLTTLFITILVLAVSLSFHEFAHAWMANRLGDPTAANAGRLSMNPLHHLDPIGSLVFVLTRRIGWARPVPVNPARFDRKYTVKRGMMLTSLAGPVSNFILGTLSVILYYVVTTILLLRGGVSNMMLDLARQMLLMFYSANMTLGLFNLLPVPPLDGYKVFGAILPQRLYIQVMRYERYIGLVFLLLVWFGGGILTKVMNVLMIPFDFLIHDPIYWLFKQLWRALGLMR